MNKRKIKKKLIKKNEKINPEMEHDLSNPLELHLEDVEIIFGKEFNKRIRDMENFLDKQLKSEEFHSLNKRVQKRIDELTKEIDEF